MKVFSLRFFHSCLFFPVSSNWINFLLSFPSLQLKTSRRPCSNFERRIEALAKFTLEKLKLFIFRQSFCFTNNFNSVFEICCLFWKVKFERKKKIIWEFSIDSRFEINFDGETFKLTSLQKLSSLLHFLHCEYFLIRTLSDFQVLEIIRVPFNLKGR